MKTTNTKSRKYVQAMEPFSASNLSGVIEGKFYVVYSYKWYPLFIYSYAEGRWFENTDRYGVSTSKQRSQSRPHENCISLTHDQMKDLLQGRTVVA